MGNRLAKSLAQAWRRMATTAQPHTMAARMAHQATLAAMAISTAAMWSCDNGTTYHRYAHLGTWYREDSVTLCVPPMAQGGTYSQELLLRVDGSYPFTAIAIVARQHIVYADTTLTDTTITTTINCPLYDGDGLPTGHGLSTYQHSFDMPAITLSQGDSIAITLSHDMRRNPVDGITDIGVRISRGR